jgi:hypothetical protein
MLVLFSSSYICGYLYFYRLRIKRVKFKSNPRQSDSLTLVVLADSYMSMFMPRDISSRIARFLECKTEFPIIEKDELMAVFYLFGKDVKIENHDDALIARDLAKRTLEQLARQVRNFHDMQTKMSSAFIRENYTRRVLQISIDMANELKQSDMKERIGGDPSILFDCFAQHVAYYKQDYFFELFQPLKENQIPSNLKEKLLGRMVLLGFNVKDQMSLPLGSTLIHFIKWLEQV